MLYTDKEYTKFKSIDEKLEKLRSLGIISSKAKEIKDLFYKGVYVDESTICDVVGFVDDIEIVIDVQGKLHTIHPVYFKEMQSKNFSIFSEDIKDI